MDFRDLKYKLEENKGKLLVLVGVVAIALTTVGLFKMFDVDLGIGKNKEDVVSEKYVLAKGIFGANNSGEINYYDIKSGKILDNETLEGNSFIYSNGDTLKNLNAYDSKNSILYNIQAKGKKISVSKGKELNLKNKSIINFKATDKYFIGLLNNQKTLVCKDLSSNKETKIDLKSSAQIDSYAIVGDYMVATSDKYIYRTDLIKNKNQKIEIGESSLSINIIGEKVYIHNAFGYERGKSIILDINPKDLYINNMQQFKDSNVNFLRTSSESDKMYYSEEFLTSKEGKVNQVFKYMGEDMKNPVSTMKYVGEFSVTNLNAYGNLGHIYYQEKDKLKVFNLKSHEEEYSFKLIDDFYMPIY